MKQRRRELALLKSFGLTRRQLAAAVAWQSTVVVFVGLVIGVPLGIVVGRLLWGLFAHQLSAVVDSTIPAVVIILVAIGALVIANLVARMARTQCCPNVDGTRPQIRVKRVEDFAGAGALRSRCDRSSHQECRSIEGTFAY